MAKLWADLYESETLEHNTKCRVTSGNCGIADDDAESEAFAQVFHALVHSSPALSITLAQLEHQHAVAVHAKCQEMADTLATSCSGNDNDMEVAMTRAKLESDISHLKETQKREYRDWVVKCMENVTENAGENKGKLSKSDSAYFMMSSGVSSPAPPSGGAVNSALQESFTITLGAQLKQMHNLRLVAANPIQLCRYDILGGGATGSSSGDGGGFGHEDDWLPRRLQTAMSLYSHNLSGLVLLTESNLNEDTPTDTTLKFGQICSTSTEYHFPSFEQQLESLKLEAKRQLTSPASDGNDVISTGKLKCGDFYMTRHSNLCEVHVVFHMLTAVTSSDGATCDNGENNDDVTNTAPVPLTSSEKVNSRHPVVMGLRSVLKTASLCGVTTLTIPLLLTMTLTDEMTSVSWCLRRAELVFKCVKGFMMEVASCGGGEDLKTLQFVVPKDIDQDVFHRLTSMLASIFRSSNPIKAS